MRVWLALFFCAFGSGQSLTASAGSDTVLSHVEAIAIHGMADLNTILSHQALVGCDSSPAPPRLHWYSSASGPATTVCFQQPDPSPEARSANLEYFRKLVARGADAPLDDFLKFWFPEPKEIDGSPFFACEEAPMGNMKPDAAGNLPSSCQPDTLYAWVPKEKLEALAQLAPQGGQWEGSLNRKDAQEKVFFTSMSPASTYGYGEYLVRFTVKEGVPFRFHKYGAEMGEVGVADFDFHDYAIKDASVIDGYSYGQPENYDELVRDILRFRSGERVTVYSGCKAALAKSGLDRLYAQCVDNHPQDEAKLKENLLNLLRQILAHEGRIMHPKGICRLRREVFATSKTSYVNPTEKNLGLALMPGTSGEALAPGAPQR